MRKTMILAAVLSAFALPAAAQSDSIGAPGSAAGGVHTEPLSPPSSSLPSAAGPLDSTGGLGQSTSPSIHDLTPGTGKFEGPNNGTTTPCNGSTGFGASGGIPGHKC
ncbi:MAG TPA: hypothetical protein VHA35_10050 [Dongiaceae bacterium]|jgi:hypothetical protein|nr:hypothetical protein [Dongiaceae bacterium]